jgi:hypothetical protein
LIGKEGTKNSLSPKLDDNYLLKESRNKPGPGSYDYDPSSSSAVRKSPAFKVGTSKRENSVPKGRLILPDPTAYKPNDMFTKT